MSSLSWLDVAYAGLLVVYVAVKCQHRYSQAIFLKMATSAFFLAIGGLRFVENPSVAGGCLLAGLACGFAGDYWLDMKYVTSNVKKSERYTFSGFYAFVVAHFFNIGGMLCVDEYSAMVDFSSLAGRVVLPGLVFAAIVILGEKPSGLSFGRFKLISFGYGWTLFCAALLSLDGFLRLPEGTEENLMFKNLQIGLVMFLLSDLVLSHSFFGTNKHTTPFIIANYFFYYGAQWYIARSIGVA